MILLGVWLGVEWHWYNACFFLCNKSSGVYLTVLANCSTRLYVKRSFLADQKCSSSEKVLYFIRRLSGFSDVILTFI